MGRGSRLAAFGIGVAVLSAAIAGGALAGERATTKDRRVLQPVAQRLDPAEEARITALMARMTLEEKLNQLTLLSDGQMKANPAEARNPVGGVFSETDPVLINRYQRDAVENSRLGIPILFAFDTIHGFRTIFPIPLGAASSFDPAVAEADHRIGAFESAAVGLKQIYSPMVDVSHDPRWGRISEAAGEDPYLNSVMAAARVRGAQGSDYAAPDKVVTSVKHFAAYGQPEAGRDYNTTDMSLQRLWNLYLPPFKAAVEAGSDTLMCSFNAINGVPGCANRYLETTVLKQRWGFDGFVESDYTAVAELRDCPGVAPAGGPCGHGYAEDGRDAARKALRAGTDSEMVSTTFRDFGARLVASGQVPLRRIDDAVRRILRVKVRAGLFENPYVDVAAAPGKQLLPENRAAARRAAGRSMVLLENEGGVLPLDPAKSTAIIGPLGDSGHDMLGPWWGRGADEDVVSVFQGMLAQNPSTTFTPGCTLSHNELYDPEGRMRVRRRVPGGGGRRAGGRPGRARPGRDAGDERRGRVAHGPRPARPPGGADRGHPGDRQAVRRRAVQRAPAHAGGGLGVVAGDPRGVVPRRRGGQRRGGRALRPRQPRRQAAGELPAQRRAGAHLLQPRADGPPVRRDEPLQLAPPRHPQLRAALRVRVRAELHDVLGVQPAAERARR